MYNYLESASFPWRQLLRVQLLISYTFLLFLGDNIFHISFYSIAVLLMNASCFTFTYHGLLPETLFWRIYLILDDHLCLNAWRWEVLVAQYLLGTFDGNSSQSCFLGLVWVEQANRFPRVRFGKSSMIVIHSLQVLTRLHQQKFYLSWCVQKMGSLQCLDKVSYCMPCEWQSQFYISWSENLYKFTIVYWLHWWIWF